VDYVAEGADGEAAFGAVECWCVTQGGGGGVGELVGFGGEEAGEGVEVCGEALDERRGRGGCSES
jgi:hypothetical protein